MSGENRQNNGTPPEDFGGSGGLLSNPDTSVADLNLIGRAIGDRWPIPHDRRQRILTTLQQIVETDTFEIEKIEHEEGTKVGKKTATVAMPNHRNQVAAARCLLLADRMNQVDEHAARGSSSETTINIDARRITVDQVDLDALERVRQRLNGSLGGHRTE